MRLNKWWLGVAGGAILLVGLVAGALISGGLPAWAAGALGGNMLAGQSSPAPTGYCQTYLQALANTLNVPEATLLQANQSALKATIQQAYKDGKISQTQEQNLLNRVANAKPCDRRGLGRFVGGPRGAGVPQVNGARAAIETAVAGKLGISSATLESDLRSGKTLQQIASDRGIALTGTNGLNAAYLAAVQQQLNQAVRASSITQTQADAAYRQAQQGVQSGHYLFLTGGPRHWGGGSPHSGTSGTTPA
jgi:hypothetical protein